MGNEHNQEQKKTDIIDVQLSHQKFVNSKLVKVNNAVNVQTIIGCEEKEYERWRKVIEAIKQQSQHLFLPLNWSFSTKNLCGSSGHVSVWFLFYSKLNFPHYPYLLSQEIYNRIGKKTKFEETDLWYLLYSLSAARLQIAKYGLKNVGDIRTGNVFLNDEGKVKVGCQISWPNEISVWQKAMDKEIVYMAPEDFECLSQGMAQVESTQSQIFSIGLTMLNAGLLIDDSNTTPLYDYKEMKLNIGEYSRRLNQWIIARGYSDILKSVVLNLCCLHACGRILHEELWDMLKIHEKQIKQRKNFMISNAPLKIHEQVRRYKQARGKLTQVFKPSSLKQLETSTVVKHEVARSIQPVPNEGSNVLESTNQEGILPVPSNLQTVNSGNLLGSEGQQNQVQVKDDKNQIQDRQ